MNRLSDGTIQIVFIVILSVGATWGACTVCPEAFLGHVGHLLVFRA
ncbi:hypothetical protein ABZZ79_32325 [Streptomyces sp. NPDC006458]